MFRKFYIVLGLGAEENHRWESEVKDFRAFACGEILYLKVNFIERMKIRIWAAKNNIPILFRKPLPY